MSSNTSHPRATSGSWIAWCTPEGAAAAWHTGTCWSIGAGHRRWPTVCVPWTRSRGSFMPRTRRSFTAPLSSRRSSDAEPVAGHRDGGRRLRNADGRPAGVPAVVADRSGGPAQAPPPGNGSGHAVFPLGLHLRLAGGAAGRPIRHRFGGPQDLPTDAMSIRRRDRWGAPRFPGGDLFSAGG